MRFLLVTMVLSINAVSDDINLVRTINKEKETVIWCGNGKNNDNGANIPCQWPMSYDGVTYDGATCPDWESESYGGYGWCRVKSNDISEHITWDECQPCEYKKYPIERKYVQLCENVKAKLGDSNEVQIDEFTEHEFSKNSEQTMQLFLAYLKHHEGEKPGPIYKPLEDIECFEKNVTDKWDAEYINDIFAGKSKFAVIDNVQDQYFELMETANKMGCEPLLKLICARIGFGITPKSVKQVKEKLI